MSRPTSLEKFRALVDTAIVQFIAHGYQRTQVSDIAASMGIANGSVYTYVESKEALFDLAVRHADTGLPSALPSRLPVPTPPAQAMIDYVRTALIERAAFPVLQGALQRTEVQDIAAEVKGIAGEIYDVLAGNRRGLRLVDRCAPDYPELGALWFSVGREGLMALLETYLGRREPQLRPFPAPAITARLMLESLVLWAVDRHFDPRPQPMDEGQARAEVVEWVTRSLVRSP